MTFYLFDPKTAEIGGRVFHDTDGDNTELLNTGGFEPPIEGVIVQLLNEHGHVIATTTTNHNGEYNFICLPAGNYTILFPTSVDDKLLVEKDVGHFGTDSDADQTTGKTIQIHVDKAQKIWEVDAGYSFQPTLDGIVEGTAGDDLIDVNYTGDPDGDRVDNNDAILPGAVGNDDLIFGFEGNDSISAGDGNDEVYGGSGDDTIDGGAGDDILYGDDSSDNTLSGESSFDSVSLNFASVRTGSETAAHPNTAVAGSSVIYDNVATLADGTEVSARMVLVEKSSDHLQVDLASNSDYEVLLNANNNAHMEGETATFRLEFFDTATGASVVMNPAIVFADLDLNNGTEVISINDANLVNVGVPSDSSLDVNFASGSLTASGTEDNIDANETDSQVATLFDSASSVTFTMASRAVSSGLNFGEVDAVDFNYLAEFQDSTAGDDTIIGGSGDDIIYGDSGTTVPGAGATVRESFEWDLQTEHEVDTTFVQNTGEVSVTFTRTADEGHHDSKLNTEHLNVDGIDDGAETIDTDSGLSSETNGQAGRGEFQWEFSDAVTNVEFNINDIDGDGVVKVLAYDAAGNKIPVQLSGGSHLTLVDSDGVNGVDTADSNGGYADTNSSSYNLQVTIPGPVARIVVEHTQDGTNNSGVVITDMYYDAVVGGPTAGGDDVITGGAGSDLMYGEDGDDIFIVQSGSDADGDQIFGGNGPDDTADLDVLDLTGAGQVTIDAVDDENDAGATKGTVTFEDGSVLTFEGIEQIITDPQNEAPTAVADVVDVDEDGAVTFDPAANDVDPDGDDLTVVAISDPANGTLVDNGDGTYTYAPNPDFNGTDSVTYTVEDPSGEQSTSTVTFNVAPVNDAPEANDDSDITDFNTPVTVDLIANDTDVDGDTLTVVAASVPADQGSLVDNGDGTVTFTPALGFTGTATISYTISDGELEDNAVHTVLVGDAPLDGTVEGTAGDDLIDGDYLGDPEGDRVDNNDAILPGAVGNDDLIFGFEGNDTILAGDGNDVVYGGEDDDVIAGGEGNDTLFGDDGNDSIAGQAGDDSVFGGLGDDTLRGGTGNDVIEGGAGNDSLFGGADNDELFGGDGDDEITGGSGDDVIFGGEGNDSILAGSGDDEVDGGAGNDTIVTGDGNDVVYGGDGNDIIDTSGHLPIPDVGYPGVYPSDPFPNDDNDLVFGGAGNDSITTGDDDDTIFGGDGADVIDAGLDDDLVYGGAGNDTIIGSEGNDEIYGDDGDDTIYGGLVTPGLADALNLPDDIDGNGDSNGPGEDLVTDNNNDTLFGGAGNDTIFGADDDDTLFGGSGDDVLDGGVDDDIIFGGEGNDTIIGGQGNDQQFGGFGSDTFLGGNGGDVVVGGEDPDDSDVDVLDLTGSNVDFITYVDGDPEAGTVTFLDGSTMTFSEIENVIPCFTPGTTIATPKGERLVEELRIGDRIITRDNGIQEIRWVGRKDMSGKSLVANPHLKPILVRAGALGNGLPERDMLVSPNHRVLVASDKTQLYFEEREVLAAAKHLVGSDGIHAVDVMGTSYIHFMFDRHEVVLSNGAWTESFQPGDYSLKGIGNSQRNEIFELFPELQEKQGLESYQSARRALKKHEAKLLIK